MLPMPPKTDFMLTFPPPYSQATSAMSDKQATQIGDLEQSVKARDVQGRDPTGGERWPIKQLQRVALDRLRHAARGSLPKAIQVWIDGLDDDDRWYRHRCAAELCNRFGLPAMTEQRHQVDSAQVQVMVFPFPNPFPPPPVPEAEVIDDVDEGSDQGEQQGSEREPVA